MLGDVLPLVRNGAFERLGAMRVALLVARPRTSLTPRGGPWPHAPGPPLDSEEATRREVLAAAEAVAGQLTRAAHGAASADYGRDLGREGWQHYSSHPCARAFRPL